MLAVIQHAYNYTNKYLCERDSSLQLVCPLNGRCRAELACRLPVNHKKCSKAIEVKISGADSFCSMRQFSPMAKSRYFYKRGGLHIKDSAIAAQACFFIISSSCQVCMWGVVRPSHVCSTRIKTLLKDLEAFPQNFPPLKFPIIWYQCCRMSYKFLSW